MWMSNHISTKITHKIRFETCGNKPEHVDHTHQHGTCNNFVKSQPIVFRNLMQAKKGMSSVWKCLADIRSYIQVLLRNDAVLRGISPLRCAFHAVGSVRFVVKCFCKFMYSRGVGDQLPCFHIPLSSGFKGQGQSCREVQGTVGC